MDLVPEEEPIGFPVRKWTKNPKAKKRTLKRKIQMGLTGLVLVSTFMLYGVYEVGSFYNQHTTTLQSPIVLRTPVKVEKREAVSQPVVEAVKSEIAIVPVAQAAEVKPKPPVVVPTNCEELRPTVEKYFGDKANVALFVASKESGCNMARVSSTQDYCAFQIHKEPATAKSVDLCVSRAWEKYQEGRLGVDNWSAWYAVCTPAGKAKFENIICS